MESIHANKQVQMEGLILGRKGIILLVLIALIGMASADSEKEEQLDQNDSAYDNPSTWEENSLKFNFEQNVSGTGFFNAFKYAHMPDVLGTEGRLFNGVEAKNKAHGSGQIDRDSVIYAESSYSNKTWINGAFDEDGEIIEDEEETTSQIQVRDESKLTYSPLVLSIGSRYYNQHPVDIKSLLKEEDWMKNRNRMNSLNHRIDQARGLNKVLDAQADADTNSMKIEEDLIDGRAHFRVLQLEEIPVDEEPEEEEESEEEESDEDASEEVQFLGLAMKAWKEPLIDIDEDYMGSYHFEKNMTLSMIEEEEEKEDSWLPCCHGGFSDMNNMDAKALQSAKGIFDCTCFKVPGKAQFPG
jgi:hypothetical protein